MTDQEWYERDMAALAAAGDRLVAQGYRMVPCQYYQQKFVRGAEEVVLVRHLGVLNWHPVPHGEVGRGHSGRL